MRESGCAVVRQGRLIALVGTFLIGCAFLPIVIGCSGTRSEAPKEEEGQGHTEATKKEQTPSPKATASEEARCEGTRTFKRPRGALKGWMIRGGSYATNDVPGCPKGGLLLGTDKADKLDGKKGDDEIRGLGGTDTLLGGYGSDVTYGEPGSDFLGGGGDDDVLNGGDGDDRMLYGGEGEDVLYGGDGNDWLDGSDRPHNAQRDKLYCGKGSDKYISDWSSGPKLDYVSSSCETKAKGGSVP